MTDIKDKEILNTIIELQSCFIQGRDLKALLHKNRTFYLRKSTADVIVICMNKLEKVQTEYILEKHRVFVHLINKYICDNASLEWEKFIQHHITKLHSNDHYYKSNDIYDIYKGLVTKRDASNFTKELGMQYSILMPLFDFDHKEIIGTVNFIFCHTYEADIEKLKEIKELFQILLQPLYDQEYNIFYNKCRLIDNNLSLLTEQEKRITKKVLTGVSYNEIAKMLNISINTLKTHMKNIFNKYNVNSKIELYNKINLK